MTCATDAGKVCSMCKALKAPSEFNHHSGRLRSECRECQKGLNARYYKPEYSRVWRERHPRPRKPKPTYAISIKPEDAAWLGGLFDGEGCIFIQRTRPTERSKKKQIVYRLAMTICMCHEPTISRVKSLLGGLGNITVIRQNNPNWATQYKWEVGNRMASTVIHAIAPYLFTKKTECETALRFLEIPTYGCRVNPEIQNRRESVYWELRRLKPTNRNLITPDTP